MKDKDGYGRSLRYVKRGKVDISKSQIVKGAKARYDSKYGYQWHPRQSTYHKADKSHKNYRCTEPKAPAKPKHPGKAEPISQWDCPSWAPIKGNQKPAGEEWIYHMPWNQFYNATTPEECFSTEEAASAAGYRAARI